jgi:hypothetical protein
MLSGHSTNDAKRRDVVEGKFNARLGRVNERAAAPAGEPFPARLDEIRRPVVPTDISHPLRTRLGFDWRRRVFFKSSAAWFVRFFSRIFASHLFPPRLISLSFGSLSRAGQEAQGIGPCVFRKTDRLGVIQRATTPAREPLPTWVDVVPGAVIEACVKQLSRTTAGLTRISAFFGAASTLIIRLFTCFFVSHN